VFSYKNSKGMEYWLHTREVKLRSGKIQKIFFFSRDSANFIDLPEGYKVVESKRTGLPLLKKV
jgi:hypothetical protein